MRSHRRSPKVRPDLFIETVPLSKNNDIAKEIYREIDQYSMTPTLLKRTMEVLPLEQDAKNRRNTICRQRP